MSLLQSAGPEMFADAAAYEQFMGRCSRLLAPLFADFAGLHPGSRVLEVGSGTGALAGVIAARDASCRVHGIDPSAVYVAYATAHAASANLTFAVGDAQQVAAPAASFDAAVALLVFNFIPDPQRALHELRRVVRPGGTIAAAVWDYGAGMQPLRLFWDAAAALDRAAAGGDEALMPLCRQGELRALWLSAGLHDVAEEGLEITARFASFDEYWAPFLLGQGPAGAYVAGLSATDATRLRDELRRRMPAGEFALRARAWAVCGIN